MIEQFLAIVRNTFFESIRQPIMLVMLVVATIALILSNPISAFTMEDDQRMLIDIGLATIFVCGTLLASFIATNVLTREIENKTALTVISKPVGRPLFVLGKFFGVGSALMLGTLFMCFVFMLVEQHTVLQTVRDPVHVPVIVFGVGSAVVGLLAGIWCNYFYGKVFASTVIMISTPLLALGYVLSMMFKPDFTQQSIADGFKLELWLALCPLMVAILVLTAIAIAASTRLGQVMTLIITLGIFCLGMMSDWILGRPRRAMERGWLDQAVASGQTETIEIQRKIELVDPGRGPAPEAPIETVVQATVPLTDFAEGGQLFGYYALGIGQAIVPNFQVLWLADAVTQGHVIPIAHVVDVTLYGFGCIGVALAVAVVLFQRREVG